MTLITACHNFKPHLFARFEFHSSRVIKQLDHEADTMSPSGAKEWGTVCVRSCTFVPLIHFHGKAISHRLLLNLSKQ